MEEMERRDNLARHVRQRRLSLGMSISAAAERAGIDRTTWTNIENSARRLHQHNYAGVERALQWPAGSVELALAGHEPLSEEARNHVVEDLMELARDLLPEDLAELVSIAVRPDLTDDERETLLASVRVTVGGLYAMIDERVARERRRSRPTSQRAS